MNIQRLLISILFFSVLSIAYADKMQQLSLSENIPIESFSGSRQFISSDIFSNTHQQIWTLESLNQAEWAENLKSGQAPLYAKAQVLLSRKYVSPGAIDGRSTDLIRAINAYQIMHDLPNNGELNQATWQSLIQDNHEPVFKEYILTASDLNQPYVKPIPTDYAEQAKMKRLYYVNVLEMLGEKFHMDESFLKKLNPHATFTQVGEKIIVANIHNQLPKQIHSLIAHKGMRQLFLMNQQNKIIAAYPTTIGSDSTPSPTGTHHIKVITHNPYYSYNPTTFGKPPGKGYAIAPGPNNPVGNTWIGLSKPSFGIHGTPTDRKSVV